MKICGTCGHRHDPLEGFCGRCESAPEIVDGIEVHAPEVGSLEGYDPALFSELARLEDSHFWFRQRNRLILNFVAKIFPNTRAYLEVGCGTGYVLQGLSRAFPEWRTWGSELHVEGLVFARQRLPTTHLLQMDARRIPFESEFDLIGSFDVLEHIPEDESVLASMHSALKPKGGLLVTVPQHPGLWSFQDEAACHVRRYARKEMDAKMRKAGFEIIRSTSFVTLLSPVMLASRLFSNLSPSARQDPLREFRVGGVANRLGELGMGVDAALISRGFDLAFGGSRIIAARRLD